MKRIKQLLKIMILTSVVFTLFLNVSANQKGSITLTFPVDTCEFKLYKIGVLNDQNEVIYEDAFKNINMDLDVTSSDSLNACSFVLEGYISMNQIQYHQNKQVKNKSVIFDQLDQGVYLILGNMIKKDDFIYSPMPILVIVPYTDGEGELIYDLSIQAKYESEPYDPDKKDSIKVIKVWDDKGMEDIRPENINIKLLCDDYVYDEVTLNINNNYTYEWKDLENHHVWNVVEEGLDQYTKKIEKNQNMIILTNSIDHNDDGGIPQTGQPWVPALVLGLLGIVLVIFGIFVGKREKSL